MWPGCIYTAGIIWYYALWTSFLLPPGHYCWEIGRRSVLSFFLWEGRYHFKRVGNLPKIKQQARCGFLILTGQRGRRANPVGAWCSCFPVQGQGGSGLGDSSTENLCGGCLTVTQPLSFSAAPCIPLSAPSSEDPWKEARLRSSLPKVQMGTLSPTEVRRPAEGPSFVLCGGDSFGRMWTLGWGQSLFSSNEW